MARRLAVSATVIIVLVLLVAGCLLGENTYESPQGYSFSYPDPWKVAKGPYEKSFIFQADPDVVLDVKDKSDEVSFVFTAGAPIEGPLTKEALNEDLVHKLASISVRLPGFEPLSSKVSEEDSVKRQEFTYSVNGKKGKSVRGHFVRLINTKGEKFFLNVNMVSTPSDFRYSDTDFEDIVESIKLPEEQEKK